MIPLEIYSLHILLDEDFQVDNQQWFPSRNILFLIQESTGETPPVQLAVWEFFRVVIVVV